MKRIDELGFQGHRIGGAQRIAIGITGNDGAIDPANFSRFAGVANFHQEQALRRRRGTGLGAILGRERVGHPRLGSSPAADQDQCTGDRPDHVVQKPVRLDVEFRNAWTH